MLDSGCQEYYADELLCMLGLGLYVEEQVIIVLLLCCPQVDHGNYLWCADTSGGEDCICKRHYGKEELECLFLYYQSFTVHV